ncbi:glycosyltransferase family 61 protein [Rhizorhabdus sp. FW153]|uniref:glycosyltransferase family 61 protein n=1 Tax=Rhizorhabdus sp. FW153 TaxID=3400216 RepID=UPI003CEB085E
MTGGTAEGVTGAAAALAPVVVPRWEPEIFVSDAVTPSAQLDIWTYRPQSKFTAPEIRFSEPQPLMTIGGSFLTLAERDGLVSSSTYLNDGRWREALAAAGSFLPIEGTVLVAGNAVTRNHYHWLVQCLAPILIAEHLGVAPGCHMLVPSLTPLRRESIVAASISPDRVVELAPGEVALPALGIHSNLTGGDFAFCPHPTLVAAFDRLMPPPSPSPFAGQRVYIARFDAWKRKMVNEEELRDRLEALGFVTLLASELSFADQMALFRDADTIVTQHGAAMTNILFTPGAAGPRVIELHQENYLHMAFLKLGQVKRLRYSAIINPMETGGPDAHRSTWRADLPLIERVVEQRA